MPEALRPSRKRHNSSVALEVVGAEIAMEVPHLALPSLFF